MHFDTDPFMYSCESGWWWGWGWGLHGFKFGIFISRFPSDGEENMAVKGLTPSCLWRGTGGDRDPRRRVVAGGRRGRGGGRRGGEGDNNNDNRQ